MSKHLYKTWKCRLGRLKKKKILSERSQGSLPCKTKANLKEQIEAMTFWSSKGVRRDQIQDEKKVEEEVIKEKEVEQITI